MLHEMITLSPSPSSSAFISSCISFGTSCCARLDIDLRTGDDGRAGEPRSPLRSGDVGSLAAAGGLAAPPATAAATFIGSMGPRRPCFRDQRPGGLHPSPRGWQPLLPPGSTPLFTWTPADGVDSTRPRSRPTAWWQPAAARACRCPASPRPRRLLLASAASSGDGQCRHLLARGEPVGGQADTRAGQDEMMRA